MVGHAALDTGPLGPLFVYLFILVLALHRCLSQHTEKWTLTLTEEMDKWLGVLVRHQADKVREPHRKGHSAEATNTGSIVFLIFSAKNS